MNSLKQEPSATCNIISGDPSELNPWSIHLVSLMQTIQSKRTNKLLSRSHKLDQRRQNTPGFQHLRR